MRSRLRTWAWASMSIIQRVQLQSVTHEARAKTATIAPDISSSEKLCQDSQWVDSVVRAYYCPVLVVRAYSGAI